MDVHSRHSQFNARRVSKSGPMPIAPSASFSNLSKGKKAGLDGALYSKTSFADMKSSAPSGGKISGGGAPERKIVTNSRVKKDEKLKTDMYLAFVDNALAQKDLGKPDSFNELIHQFTHPNSAPSSSSGSSSTVPTAPAQLRLWLLALSHVVSRLERKHYALVEAVINFPQWTTLDSASVKSYIGFIGILVSAKPEYAGGVLEAIVRGFTYQEGVKAVRGAPEGVTRKIVYERLHLLLQQVLTLIPTLTSSLLPLLVSHFPHKRNKKEAQETYVRNLLRVKTYCPAVGRGIMDVIVDRCVRIDVEIQVEMEELEEIVGKEGGGDDDVFELDPFDIVVGDGDDSSDDSDGEELDFDDLSDDEDGSDDVGEELPTNLIQVHEMSTKLDAMLYLVYDHFRSMHSSPERPPLTSSISALPPLPEDLQIPTTPTTIEPKPLPALSPPHLMTEFTTLLSIFDRTILLTYKSRYTQFLLFYITSLDPRFADLFMGMLVERALFAGTRGSTARSSASSYIGSFVSRARFVGKEEVRRIVGVLLSYLSSAQEQAGDMGKEEKAVVYSVCGAMFLIFCFRWRELRDDDDDDVTEGKLGWMRDLTVLKTFISGSMNPLKTCSQNVVNQFAHVAYKTGFMDVYVILDANKRLASVERPVEEEMNTFFPFDPYRLPRSSIFVHDGYREWKEVAVDESDDESDSSDSEGEEEEELGAGIPMSVGGLSVPNADEDMLGRSMGAMSISPSPGTAPIRTFGS